MSVSPRFTFDTNILFYAADRSAGAKHVRAVELTDAAIAHDCVLTLQALGELMNSMLKRGWASAETVERMVRAYRMSFPIVHAVEADLDHAILAHRQHRIPFWDAMLWATARRSGCSILLSEDFQEDRVLGGVTIRNPPTNARSLADLLQ